MVNNIYLKKFRDSDRCFRTNGFYGKSNYFTFIGDSRIRQLYLQMRDLLGAEDISRITDNIVSAFNITQNAA